MWILPKPIKLYRKWSHFVKESKGDNPSYTEFKIPNYGKQESRKTMLLIFSKYKGPLCIDK